MVQNCSTCNYFEKYTISRDKGFCLGSPPFTLERNALPQLYCEVEAKEGCDLWQTNSITTITKWETCNEKSQCIGEAFIDNEKVAEYSCGFGPNEEDFFLQQVSTGSTLKSEVENITRVFTRLAALKKI